MRFIGIVVELVEFILPKEATIADIRFKKEMEYFAPVQCIRCCSSAIDKIVVYASSLGQCKWLARMGVPFVNRKLAN